MTSQPACSWSSLIPPAARGSAIRIRMALRLSAHCFLGESGLSVSVLYRGDPCAELHRLSVGGQDDFEFGDHSEEIREIEIAEVRDAKDLAFHRALAVGDHGPEALAKFLHDHPGVKPGGGFYGSNGRAGRFRREQLQAQGSG